MSKNNDDISVLSFVEKCKQIDLFSMSMVRRVAKQTQMIADVNPNINRENALERDIFDANR